MSKIWKTVLSVNPRKLCSKLACFIQLQCTSASLVHLCWFSINLRVLWHQWKKKTSEIERKWQWYKGEWETFLVWSWSHGFILNEHWALLNMVLTDYRDLTIPWHNPGDKGISLDLPEIGGKNSVDSLLQQCVNKCMGWFPLASALYAFALMVRCPTYISP